MTRPIVRGGAAIASGLALGTAFPPWDLSLLAWVGFAPLLVAIRDCSSRGAFALGWCASATFFLVATSWIAGLLEAHTTMSQPAALGVHTLMVAWLGCYGGVFTLIVRRFDRSRARSVCLTAAMWVVLEWLRGWFPIGFPWALLGYSQHQLHGLVQIAEVTGVYGVSGLVVLVNATTAAAIGREMTGRAFLATGTAVAALLFVASTWGEWRATRLDSGQPAGSLVVVLVPSRVDQARKRDPAYADEILDHFERATMGASAANSGLIVWPEMSLPFLLEEETARRDRVLGDVRASGAAVLIGSGATIATATGRVRVNRAYLIGADGSEVGRYDKRVLVPFGEYVPAGGWHGLIRPIVAVEEGLVAGENDRPLTLSTARIGVLICYEASIPFLARRSVAAGADVLVNMSNDGWFVGQAPRDQSLVHAVFRSIENRTPLIRVANDGPSAVITPSGRIAWQSPAGSIAWQAAEVRWTSVRTVYTQVGDVFIGMCGLFLVLGGRGYRASTVANDLATSVGRRNGAR